jgi:hypothetical protein
MNKMLNVVEDIKQNITDNQYKTIIESLMEINDTNKLPLLTNDHKLNKIIYLFNWLDTKLKITDHQYDCIKKTNLQKYVINDYFDNSYYENVDIVKQILKFILRSQLKNKIAIMYISMSNLDNKLTLSGY